MKDFRNFNLLRHNTFGIEAHCRRYVEIETVDEAREWLPRLHRDGGPLLIIGGGSNLLLTRDFPGTVVRSAIKGFEAEVDQQQVLLTCGSGEVWDEVVARCVANGWYGAENLSLIPGDVGASAVQNIGAYGAEVKDLITHIDAVEVATGKSLGIDAGECAYGYRDSRFKREWKDRFFITAVTYRLSLDFQPRLDYGNISKLLKDKGIEHPTAEQLRQTVIDIRREKLPDTAVEGNAGSFFVNPVVDREVLLRLQKQADHVPYYDIDEAHVKIPAAWLIEQCGWKGKTMGNAGVHHRQALVLVNRGGATGAEVLALCERIRQDVKDRFGIVICSEVNIV